jgi:hypothetical protein
LIILLSLVCVVFCRSFFVLLLSVDHYIVLCFFHLRLTVLCGYSSIRFIMIMKSIFRQSLSIVWPISCFHSFIQRCSRNNWNPFNGFNSIIPMGASLLAHLYTRGINLLHWINVNVQIVPERKWHNFDWNKYKLIKLKNLTF